MKELPSGSQQTVGMGVSWNEEETIFEHLYPGNYTLTLRYYNFLRASWKDCQSFNFELAIAPVSAFEAQIAEYSSKLCETEHLDELTSFTISAISGFNWGDPSDVWVVRSNSSFSGKRRDVWSTTFEVPEDPARKLLFDFHLGYRFLTGDVAARLEGNTSNGEKLVSTFGFNGYNQHYISHHLPAGLYKLVVYFPIELNATISKCTPFTVQINAVWELKDNNLFSCDYPVLPQSLDLIPRDKKNSIEIMGNYLVDPYGFSFFFKTFDSMIFRLVVSSSVNYSGELLFNQEGPWNTVANTSDGVIFSDRLRAGEYLVSFVAEDFSDAVSCPYINLALSLQPRAEGSTALSTFLCPNGNVGRLPDFPLRLSLPYEFTNPEIYYSVPETGSQITSWSFGVYSNTFFSIYVRSHFLLSNIRATLQLESSSKVFESETISLGSNRLVSKLGPGRYTLVLLQDGYGTNNLVRCNPFSIELHIQEFDKWENETGCSRVDVLPLPSDFTSEYLLFGNRFNIQNEHWLVPASFANNTRSEHTATLDVKLPSLFRIYIEDIEADIDVSLYQNTTWKISTRSLLDEESFVIFLTPAVYTLDFIIYHWYGVTDDTCVTFNMEMELIPQGDLLDLDNNCSYYRKHEALWPSLPSEVTESDLPYNKEFSGYYQQNERTGYQETLKFYMVRIDFDFDIRIELGYRFVVGDLVVTLQSETDQKVIGANFYLGNILKSINNPAGLYNISVYEPTRNDRTSVMCSDFTFLLVLDKAFIKPVKKSSLTTSLSSLDLLPYLGYGKSLDLFYPNYQFGFGSTINFTLKESSLVRYSVDLGWMGMNWFEGGFSTEFRSTLEAGSHSITFTEWWFSGNLQLTILPYPTYVSERSAYCKKNVPVWVPPHVNVRPTDGYYHYLNSKCRIAPENLTSIGELYRIPLTLQDYSIVRVQVLYELSWGGLDVRIVEQNSDWNMYSGMAAYNSYQIESLLSSGTYDIIISQTVNSSLPKEQISCFEFQFGLIVNKYRGEPGHKYQDCSAYEIFPWSFSVDGGGSEEYGGPIRHDRLNLWGDRFYFGGDVTSLSTSFTITDTTTAVAFLSQDSVVGITVGVEDSKGLVQHRSMLTDMGKSLFSL
eukprot:TRINITY_DN1565_c0_g1_i5.p1 TRINITY_DN1565_c0_g1~~TRINITY_DN1565_c0_g1_i5.p1  ORF type:complete len:1113 (-),score=156.31 TRINITY_DN1565_c0_g1_i5:1878-5216(-)